MTIQPVFEDVKVGDELPILKKGPLTTAHLMRWSAAMENWHKIHYDLPFTVEHEGLPGLLINGSFKQQFIAQLLKDWAGSQGWVWKINFQFRAMDLVGDTLRVVARVKGVTRAEAYGLVEIEFDILNRQDKKSTPGGAVVALPYRDGKPVPYPFQAPRQ